MLSLTERVIGLERAPFPRNRLEGSAIFDESVADLEVQQLSVARIADPLPRPRRPRSISPAGEWRWPSA